MDRPVEVAKPTTPGLITTRLRKYGSQPAHPPIMRRIPLFLRWAFFREGTEGLSVNDAGRILRSIGIELLKSRLHLLRIPI